MIPVFYKRIRSGKRRPMQLAEKPISYQQYVTFEHSAERWYA